MKTSDLDTKKTLFFEKSFLLEAKIIHIDEKNPK